MPRKVIIGIHGLSNKPEKQTLKEWWWKSITDGVSAKRNGGGSPSTDAERGEILGENDCAMAYWADIMYQYPTYVYTSTQPYVKISGPPPAYQTGPFDLVRKWFRSAVTSLWDRRRRLFSTELYDRLANQFLKVLLKDLHYYWNEGSVRPFTYWKDDAWVSEPREIKAEELQACLKDEVQAKLEEDPESEILVIAHSMGTIIAFDCIAGPDWPVPEGHKVQLITIGSPLGLPTVRAHLQRDARGRVSYPENRLISWHNFADPKDLVAAVPYLRPHFKDSNGTAQVEDSLIQNDYHDRDNSRNSHKSFGYLRCPEVATLIDDFLRR
ncbi:MAG: hypothetical protein ACE5Q6_23920 [Dehalococcoidia bacterium]